MATKPHQFKKPEEYLPDEKQVKECFFRLRQMPGGLVLYSVEQVTVINDRVISRDVVTEKDILAITLSKIEDRLLKEIRR